jgi:hypothetical protein
MHFENEDESASNDNDDFVMMMMLMLMTMNLARGTMNISEVNSEGDIPNPFGSLNKNRENSANTTL